MWISAYPFVQNDIFLKVSYVSWIWDFGHEKKNLKSLDPYLLQNMVFLAPKRLMYTLSTWRKTFFFNFEHYGLANGKEWVCKIWWTCRNTSWLQNFTIKSAKTGPNFAQPCFQKGVVLKQFWTQSSLRCLGVKELPVMQGTILWGDHEVSQEGPLVHLMSPIMSS
jgi:hypothetical protein